MAQFNGQLVSLMNQYALLVKSVNPDDLYLRQTNDSLFLEPCKPGVGSRLYRWGHRSEYDFSPLAQKVSDLVVGTFEDIFTQRLQIQSIDLGTLYVFSDWLDKRIENSGNKVGVRIQQELVSQITHLGKKIEGIQANIAANEDLQKEVQELLKGQVGELQTEFGSIASGKDGIRNEVQKIGCLAQKVEHLCCEYSQESNLAFLRNHGYLGLAEKFEVLSKLDSFSPMRDELESDVCCALRTTGYLLSGLVEEKARYIANERKKFNTPERLKNEEYLLEIFKQDSEKICKRSSFSFQEQLNCIVSLVSEETKLKRALEREDEAFHYQPKCGKATVRLKSDGSACEIGIDREILSPDSFVFYATENGARVGHIKISIFARDKDGMLYSLDKQTGDMKRVVHVDIMYSMAKTKLRGIGTALLQTAMEEGYNQGCEGRMDLTAAWSSHAFHYLQGFRSPWEEKNKQIAEIVRQNQESGTIQDSSRLCGVPMYLPLASRTQWKKQIREHPVLDSTKEERVMRLLRS